MSMSTYLIHMSSIRFMWKTNWFYPIHTEIIFPYITTLSHAFCNLQMSYIWYFGKFHTQKKSLVQKIKPKPKVRFKFTFNSPSNITLNHSQSQSYCQEYHGCRRQFPEELFWRLVLPIQNNAKNLKKSLKPWQMGTHLRVLCKSFLMSTNMTGFGWFSKIFASVCFGRK